VLGIVIDKKRLLEDKPTAIWSQEDRRKPPEFLGALAKEAQRRNLDVTDVPYEVIEPDAGD